MTTSEVKHRMCDSNILLTTECDIRAICDQFFTKSPINYFGYADVSANGTYFVLSTHAAWHRHIYESKIYAKERLDAVTEREQIVVWDSLWPLRAAHAKENFHLNQCITLARKLNNRYELCCFGTNTDRFKSFDFYLNNMNLLKTFIAYFKDKSMPIIKSANEKKHQLLLDGYVDDFKKNKIFNNQNFIDDNIPDFSIDRYVINVGKDKSVYLTKREIQCLLLTLQGKSAKKVAAILNISPKSVEFYIKNAKTKWGCYSKQQLFQKALQSGLLALME